jgi:hypothetical protein
MTSYAAQRIGLGGIKLTAIGLAGFICRFSLPYRLSTFQDGLRYACLNVQTFCSVLALVFATIALTKGDVKGKRTGRWALVLGGISLLLSGVDFFHTR